MKKLLLVLASMPCVLFAEPSMSLLLREIDMRIYECNMRCNSVPFSGIEYFLLVGKARAFFEVREIIEQMERED